MKKNIVGHMKMSAVSPKTRFRRLDILPRVLCLLLAFLIWLTVTNVNDTTNLSDYLDGTPTEAQEQ